MPNLFGGLSVINTNFSVKDLSRKRMQIMRDNPERAESNARNHLIKERTKDFAKIFETRRHLKHFFINNKPRGIMAYDKLVSCNTISKVLNFWAASKLIEIKQIRLIKNKQMKAIDE